MFGFLENIQIAFFLFFAISFDFNLWNLGFFIIYVNYIEGAITIIFFFIFCFLLLNFIFGGLVELYLPWNHGERVTNQKKKKTTTTTTKDQEKKKADLTPGCMHSAVRRRSGGEDAAVAVQWSRGNFSFLSIRVCVFKDNETKR